MIKDQYKLIDYEYLQHAQDEAGGVLQKHLQNRMQIMPPSEITAKAQKLVLYRRNSTVIMSNTDYHVLDDINSSMLQTFRKKPDGSLAAHIPGQLRRTNSESELIEDHLKKSKIEKQTEDYRLKNCVPDTKMPIFEYPLMQFEHKIEDFAEKLLNAQCNCKGCENERNLQDKTSYQMILESVLEHKRQLKRQNAELQRQRSIKFRFQRQDTGRKSSESNENVEKTEICKKYSTQKWKELAKIMLKSEFTNALEKCQASEEVYSRM